MICQTVVADIPAKIISFIKGSEDYILNKIES
jgi:hypothetical protein